LTKYLLDTDICIYIAKQKPGHILARFDRMHPGDVGMSVVTYLELMYGARRAGKFKRISPRSSN